MRLNWRDLGTPHAEKAHGMSVEWVSFPIAALLTPTADHFLLTAEPGCWDIRVAGLSLIISRTYGGRSRARI